MIITAADPAIGVDIYLNNGDLGYSQDGDLSLVGDVNPSDNMWQAINLRVATVLGTYLWQVGYGTLAGQFVDEPATTDLINQIDTELRSTVLKDPRVSAITSLVLTIGTGTITAQLAIVDIAGTVSSGTVTVPQGGAG